MMSSGERGLYIESRARRYLCDPGVAGGRISRPFLSVNPTRSRKTKPATIPQHLEHLHPLQPGVTPAGPAHRTPDDDREAVAVNVWPLPAEPG